MYSLAGGGYGITFLGVGETGLNGGGESLLGDIVLTGGPTILDLLLMGECPLSWY